MAGTVIGKIDCDISALNTASSQEQFKNLFDFFEQMVTAGYATRIALQWGASGTGTDYHDGANPFGENAFAVFRMNGKTSGNSASARDGVILPDFDYFVLIQWADSVNFGLSPGDPGHTNNNDTIDGSAIAVAVREDGTSPWGGTTNNDGTDSKGAVVWTDGGSTAHVFPTNNELEAGARYADKSGCRRWYDSATSTARIHMVGDADGFVMFADVADNTAYYVTYIGVYEPLAGLTPPMPLVCLTCDATTWYNGTGVSWGSLDCGNQYEGGVLSAHMATDGMAWCTVGMGVGGVLENIVQPNTEPTTAEHDAFPIRVAVSGIGRNPGGRNWRSGYVGDLPTNLIQVVDNVATETTNAALTRAFLGINTVTSYKHSVPWDGVTVPGTTLTRAGVTF